MTTDDPSTSGHARGTPRWVTIDGIVEGRIGDQGLLTEAVRGLDALGLGRFELERDGGRFSILPDNRQRAGNHFDEARQQELLAHLTTLARAAKGPLESTLRCTMVFDDECAETLFRGGAGAAVEPLTRVRPLGAGDAPAAPPPLSWHRRFSRRELLVGLPLAALLIVLALWQARTIDRLLGTDAAALVVDPGAFRDLLSVQVEDSWGDYAVTVARGPGWPTSSAAWDARVAAAVTERERFHAVVAREGRELFVRLCDDEERVLATAPASLLALAAAEDGAVEVMLPGSTKAGLVQLGVTARAPR